MRSYGNMEQWTDGYPSADTIAADIAADQCFVGIDNSGKIRFVFTLIFGPDPTYSVIYDGAWPSDEPYATLHRVASDGSLNRVLERCVSFALTRISHLRIDTHKDNRPMLRAIERCGFQRCGVIHLADGSPREAFALCSREAFTFSA